MASLERLVGEIQPLLWDLPNRSLFSEAADKKLNFGYAESSRPALQRQRSFT